MTIIKLLLISFVSLEKTTGTKSNKSLEKTTGKEFGKIKSLEIQAYLDFTDKVISCFDKTGSSKTIENIKKERELYVKKLQDNFSEDATEVSPYIKEFKEFLAVKKQEIDKSKMEEKEKEKFFNFKNKQTININEEKEK